jgi:formylglycine-generating enzyme required for sulfatase activity
MNCVTWAVARAYCRDRGGDLPTEAEWEYAARAGTTTSYPWGPSFDPTRAIQSVECGARGCRGATSPVVQEGPRCNAWGVCDVVGNVWQWTLTDYREELGAYVSEVPSATPSNPVHRGGAWLDNVASLFRSAHRGLNYPDHGLTGVGFRCVVRRPATHPD